MSATKSGVIDRVLAFMASRTEPRTTAKADGVFHAVCRDAAGKVEWEVKGALNTLANEGANKLRDLWWKNASAIGADTIYTGLSTSTPTVTSTLASITEASGGSYARKLTTTANWNSATTGQANNTGNPVSWTAVATPINAVTYLFITNVLSGTAGTFFSFALLTGGPYTINVGSTLTVSYTWTVS